MNPNLNNSSQNQWYMATPASRQTKRTAEAERILAFLPTSTKLEA